MGTIKICPGCQKPLAPKAPDGLCPECLVKAGLPTGADLGQDSHSESGQTPFAAPSVEELARLFPKLEILGFIGQGGMGAVYKARQPELDRVVALKILPPDISRELSFAERFTREARALAKLNHSGIVTLYEFGRADGLYFFLMEFVDGVTLRQLLQNGRVSPREALAIVPQICDALQYAHDQGIVHRDIKPENILLDRQGRLKVADFGLAKLISADSLALSPSAPSLASETSALTEAGKMMGTPHYMAPEQREHPAAVDHRADVYSLGVVFYQMLTGELPGKPIEPPSSKATVDVRLDEVVLKALEKDPGKRHQQVSQVKTAVKRIVDKKSTQKPLLLWAVGASVCAALFLAFLLFQRSPFDPPKTVAPETSDPAIQWPQAGNNSPSLPPQARAAEGFALLFQKKDFSGAIAIFQDCIRDHPTYHDAYHGMAMALRDAGDPAKALPNHDRAIELSPQRADYYLVRGITCQRLKNHDAAIKTFELGLAAKDTRYCEPGFLQAALAKSLRARGELQKALTFNTQAIELNPENDWLYLERAYTYLAMGQTERADADFATSKEKLKKLK